MVCVRWTIRGSKNVPVNRNPGVCVCVCVCEEGKGGVTYVVPEFTSDYMAKFTRSTKEKKREEGKEEEEERERE